MIARSPASSSRSSTGDEFRVFLDANVLFSAAYRAGGGLGRLWTINDNITLCSSKYAIAEAERNLADGGARQRLEQLLSAIEVVSDVATGEIPAGVDLPEKDRPILLAAIRTGATHLLTGDRAHFGDYFGRRVSGVLIMRPGDFLSSIE